MRRYRARDQAATSWERNWLRNHPVQGTAAALFKVACIRLDKLYVRHDARLILPVHDAVVFEAPSAQMLPVAELTTRVLTDAVRERFPRLNARAVVNAAKPASWNKDGRPEEWEKKNGLDPAKDDSAKVMPGGYTAVEVYLNELAASLVAK